MMSRNGMYALMVAAGLAVAVVPAFSQSTSTTPIEKLSIQYSEFSGSQQNSDALVAGLRDGTPITLTASKGVLSAITPSATFTPATGKLSPGNINIALSLAKEALAKEGVTNPSPAQLAAALNGGTFATTSGTVTMTGVLVQRKAGAGWGQIANAQGVKLGSVVSASKTDKTGTGAKGSHKSETEQRGQTSQGGNGGNGGGKK
jgi:hypothetical protein